MPTTTGIATSFIDFTRASNATVTDSDGKVKWAPHNLLTNSESFDAASWTKNISLIAANSIAAPNGTTTADKLYPSTSGTKSGVLARPTAVEEQYTLSVYAKAGGKNFITFTDFSAGSARAWANLSTGAKTETAGYFLTVTSAGSGWWRCDFTQTAKVASPYAFFIVCDADSSDAVTVNGTDGIYIWGAALYRSDLAMQPNTSAYQMYNPTTPKNLLGFTESLTTGWNGTNGGLQGIGAELVANGTFDANINGWTDSGTLSTWVSGTMQVSGNGSSYGLVYTPITTVVGRSYIMSVNVASVNRADTLFLSAGSTTAFSGIRLVATASIATYVFTATSTTTYIKIESVYANTLAVVDNVSVQEVAAYEAPNGLQTARAVNATAANNTLLSSISLLASPYTFSVWLKRKAGGGNVQLTVDGTTYATVAVTDTWTRFSTTLTPSAGTKTPGIRLVTSGDAVYLWGAQLSDSASLDPYVPVYGAAVTSAAYYGPRRDFDGATLVCKGLLVEEQRTNLVRYSRTLETTGSYWGGLASGTANTVTIDNAPGPDGLSTSASMITYNTAVTGAGTYSAWRHTLSTTANGTYTFTIWLKAGTTSSVYLRFSDSGGNRANTLCTLTSSWQRFTVTGTTTASITTISCDVGADGNAGGQTLTAGTVYASGAQLEAGGFATSYVPNGSTINGTTRNADVASVSTQAFPYSSTDGTWVANFQTLYSGTTSSTGLFLTLDADVNKRILYTITGNDTMSSKDASTIITATGDITGSPSKSASAYDASGRYVVSNGGTVASGAITAGYASGSVVNINNSGSPVNLWLRQITYLPRRISNTELQQRTSA